MKKKARNSQPRTANATVPLRSGNEWLAALAKTAEQLSATLAEKYITTSTSIFGQYRMFGMAASRK